MKCYYHPDIDAVSTCKECSKHLCRECYDKGHNGLCQSCLKSKHERVKSEKIKKVKINHHRYLKSSKIALLLGTIIGILLSIGVSINPEYSIMPTDV